MVKAMQYRLGKSRFEELFGSQLLNLEAILKLVRRIINTLNQILKIDFNDIENK